jgi:hypothetical protein
LNTSYCPEESFTWSFPAAIGITEGSENVEASLAVH